MGAMVRGQGSAGWRTLQGGRSRSDAPLTYASFPCNARRETPLTARTMACNPRGSGEAARGRGWGCERLRLVRTFLHDRSARQRSDSHSRCDCPEGRPHRRNARRAPPRRGGATFGRSPNRARARCGERRARARYHERGAYQAAAKRRQAAPQGEVIPERSGPPVSRKLNREPLEKTIMLEVFPMATSHDSRPPGKPPAQPTPDPDAAPTTQPSTRAGAAPRSPRAKRHPVLRLAPPPAISPPPVEQIPAEHVRALLFVLSLADEVDRGMTLRELQVKLTGPAYGSM